MFTGEEGLRKAQIRERFFMEMMSRHSEIVGDVKMVRTIHGLSRSRCIYPSMLGSGYMRVLNSQSPETFQRQSLFFQLVLFLFFFVIGMCRFRTVDASLERMWYKSIHVASSFVVMFYSAFFGLNAYQALAFPCCLPGALG